MFRLARAARGKRQGVPLSEDEGATDGDGTDGGGEKPRQRRDDRVPRSGARRTRAGGERQKLVSPRGAIEVKAKSSLAETHVAAPPTADVRVLPAPAAPLVAVENAPAAPEVAVEKAPAAPEVAVEKAPAAPEVAVSKTPPPNEVTVEAAPPAPEVTNLRGRLGGQSVIEPRLGGSEFR